MEGCDWFVFIDYGKINQPYLEDGETMIYFLLIAIIAMTGWLMITLNAMDRTNHDLIRDTNLNQVKIIQRIDAMQTDINLIKDRGL